MRHTHAPTQTNIVYDQKSDYSWTKEFTCRKIANSRTKVLYGGEFSSKVRLRY